MIVVDRDVERWMQPVCAATERVRDGSVGRLSREHAARRVCPCALMAGWQLNPHERIPMPHPRHHTVGLTLLEGSRRMAKWWYRSRPHRVQMLARDINYVGLGIARRGSRITYTAIFTRSRDKTRPQVVIREATWTPVGSSSQVTLDWHGVDPRLATGTAGIERFDIEHYRPLAGWGRVDGDPLWSKRSIRAPGGGDQRFRIRAVDKAGNVGAWVYTSIDIPERLPPWV